MGKRVVIATIRVEPGRMEEYLPLLQALMKRSVQEQPGTLRQDILRSHDDENTLLAYGVFTNSEAIGIFEKGEPFEVMGESVAKANIDTDISLHHCDFLD